MIYASSSIIKLFYMNINVLDHVYFRHSQSGGWIRQATDQTGGARVSISTLHELLTSKSALH